jgi:pullulanase/glycogen debranching enzyme
MSDKTIRVREGLPHPRGATWDGNGVNFSLFSAHATKVEVCLFDSRGENRSIELPEFTDEIWHGYIEGIGPGTVYGYRVHGPYEPQEGHRFNSNKLLLDPYAREFIGQLRWNHACFGYTIGAKGDDLTFDERDSAPFVPKCVVVDPGFDWKQNSAPLVPWDRTVIYETHVRGYTKLHLRSEACAEHSQAVRARGHRVHDSLATTVELLPIHILNDSYLLDRGLTNYWAITRSAFSPIRATCRSDPGAEFKRWSCGFDAGIEVILDVVYNHTAEGNERATLAFRDRQLFLLRLMRIKAVTSMTRARVTRSTNIRCHSNGDDSLRLGRRCTSMDFFDLARFSRRPAVFIIAAASQVCCGTQWRRVKLIVSHGITILVIKSASFRPGTNGTTSTRDAATIGA